MWIPGARTEAQLFVIHSCGTGSKLQQLVLAVVWADASQPALDGRMRGPDPSGAQPRPSRAGAELPRHLETFLGDKPLQS